MAEQAARQLEGNIVATVSTAEAVLVHFERSLVEAGFAEGAESYTRLADTLIGQRLWAEASGTADNAPFAAVGARARAIHALMLPYVEAFGRLAVLAAPSLIGDTESSGDLSPSADSERSTRRRAGVAAPSAPAPSSAPAEGSVAAAVLRALDASAGPMSSTSLRASLKLSRAELLAALQSLDSAGWVERRNVSGRELVSRSERS
ncbi:hypothetical protein [Cellulomonas sp. Leaf334]|uniref:hypothetical protein n=1 Tax=Cellulomonas sp. Leaf334 TaxID=1736339 RepID=UPI000700E7FF|nr:hypothetical protein [Cellulomonas sp. Leaf334]KQR16015.1 hypothetical protein ASF78_00800 [Cellulomonas sp. Leaf334]